MRRFLIDELDANIRHYSPALISGLTGCGKTQLLMQIDQHIDLEGLANHRGSAFGRNPHDFQPSPIDFENNLSIAFLKLREQSSSQRVFIEDEGRRIGRISLPEALFKKMHQAPRIILQESIENRVQLIKKDYISSCWPIYQSLYGVEAEKLFADFVLDNLLRIKKRLGGERFKTIHQIFVRALQALFESDENKAFDEGIRLLLVDYYDPMYEYQISSKQPEILFRGDSSEVMQWVKNETNC